MLDYGKNISLRILDNLSKQNFRRKWCNEDVCSFKNRTTKLRLPPFQFDRSTIPNNITSILIHCYNDSSSDEIIGTINTNDLDITTLNGVDIITYYGNIDLSAELDCGTFYLEITDGINIWFTEVFTVEEFDNDYGQNDLRINEFNDILNISAIDNLSFSN